MLASRAARLVAVRRSERRDRKVAIVLFNFPPNAGNTGTAAFLSVFESLYRTLSAMSRLARARERLLAILGPSATAIGEHS